MLIGNFNLYDTDYYLVIKSVMNKSVWSVYSSVHPEDYLKSKEEQSARLFDTDMFYKKGAQQVSEEYCIGAILLTFGRPSGYWGNVNLLTTVFENYSNAKSYGYTKDEVIVDETTQAGKHFRVSLNMVSNHSSFKEVKVSKKLIELSFSYNDFKVDLVEYPNFKLPEFDWEKFSEREVSKSAVLLNVNRVSVEALENYIDLSWYYDKETGQLKKDYTDVRSDLAFELNVINPLVRDILIAQETGEELLIGYDAETTGLMFYYLSEDNPLLDHVVSVQISWKDDQGVNVYLDMAYFENANTDYVLSRLAQLFRWERGNFEFDLRYDDNGNPIDKKVILNRDAYAVGGHNFNFDSRVMRRHGYEVFFDEDTLQMAFTLAPTSFKVAKDLKSLTRKLLGVESPELSTILGKGNEDKFRYLMDHRVANIYGCADVDMFRGVWKKLKALMDDTDPKLYKGYKRIDVYTCNVLARSEYYGVRADNEYIRLHAEQKARDLEILEEQIYSFVGKSLLLRAHSVLGRSYTKEEFDSAKYIFKVTGDDLRKVVFDYLGYPVKVWTESGQAALNSYAIDKLLFYQNEKPSGFLKNDILSCSSTEDEPVVLISAKKFNSYKYPLMYILKEYRTLLKEYTGYYKPFAKNDTEGRIFKGYKTTNIETRRISNPLQTVKKDIKKCILSHEKDWNLADWDLAQIELRMFTSMAHDTRMIELMYDGDVDFHTENGAMIYGVPSHLLPKADRAKAKAVGFGVPYGLSPRALCEWMFTVVNQKNMLATNEVLYLYEKKNHLSMDLLKSYRAKANVDAYMSPQLRDFLGIAQDAPVAIVKNLNGFYRYQDMTKIKGDKAKTASVERAFGNFPIQSFAADYFKMLICRLDRRLRKEGLSEKFILHMTIHDEILFSFHKSIDPNFLCKLIKEECMLRIKGHTNYFLGLNFGDNWYECKQDAAELPVKFLQRVCADYDAGKLEPVEWCDSPAKYYAPKVFEFKKDRVLECLEDYQPEYKKGLKLNSLWDNFTNYTVRSYFYDLPISYTPLIERDEDGAMKRDKKSGKPVFDSNDRALSALMGVLQERGYEGVIQDEEGSIFTLDNFIEYKNTFNVKANAVGTVEDVEIDLDEYEDSDVDSYVNKEFWSFDDSETAESMFFYSSDEFSDLELQANELLALHEDEYEYVDTLGATKILMVRGYDLAQKLEYLLAQYRDPKGTRVRIDYGGSVATSAVTYNLPSDDKLNAMIAKLHEEGLGKSSVFH